MTFFDLMTPFPQLLSLGARFSGAGAFPYVPMIRGEGGDRGGRGRMGPPSRSYRGVGGMGQGQSASGERGHSPPVDVESPLPLDREKGEYKAGRGLRDSSGGGAGGAGGRLRYSSDDRDRKIPRLKNMRGRVGGTGGVEGDRPSDKNQLPPVSLYVRNYSVHN